MATTWANSETRFWTGTQCDGLYLIFDTSAHLWDGDPHADPDEVLAHVAECSECQEADIRVSALTDGTYELEGHGIN